MTVTNHLQSPVETPTSSPRSVAGRAERRLRSVLGVNAATSIAVGAALAIVPDRFDDLLGTGHPGWVRIVGIAVVLFGLEYALISRSPRERLLRFTPAAIAGDATWVVLSAATALLGWYSGGGAIAVIAVAVVVDAFASLQFLAWRELRRTR